MIYMIYHDSGNVVIWAKNMYICDYIGFHEIVSPWKDKW